MEVTAPLLTHNYLITVQQHNVIRDITSSLSRADYKLFCYILVTTLIRFRQIQENSRGWIKLPKRFIQDKFRTADPSRLQILDLIQIDRRYVPDQHSRKYRLSPWVLDAFIEAGQQETEKSRRVSLVTGKLVRASPAIVRPQPQNSSLVNEAIARLDTCFFDRVATLKHLETLRQNYKEDPSPTNRFRYYNDWLVFDAIDQRATPTNEASLFSYGPTYTMQATGRIGTAAQSASRAMKQAMYGSIPNLHNYDLSSSQMVLCHHEMKRHGIFCNWIETYMTEPGKRDELARYVGVSVDTWKKCLYAVLMTGHLPTHTNYKESPVIETLEKVTTSDTIDVTLQRLREALAPLVVDLKSWHKIIKKECSETGYLTNALGITRSKESFEKTAGMIAHILQGLEAYFIHTLTILADRYDFQPIVNEHDGLITIGAIPNEAMKEAQEAKGLRCLELREKAFY